ncbi:MAG: heptosyltransferase-1 [Chlamydiales bacterium]|jgi:heptosyltransferase-1
MKILIVKTSSLGDILHTFPALSYLRGKFPEARIDWVVEKPFMDLLVGHPHLNSVIAVDSKQWRKSFWKAATQSEIRSVVESIKKQNYDVVFDLQGNIKSGIITFLANSSKKVGFSRLNVPEWPNLLFTNTKFDLTEGKNIRDDLLFLLQSFFNDSSTYNDQKVTLPIDESEKLWVSEYLARILPGGSKTVMVSPGSVWKNKQMNEVALIEFLQGIQSSEKCFFLFTWGSEKERVMLKKLQEAFPENSAILDKVRLPLLQYIMAQVDLLISMDSLPLHLCGTTMTPSYGVFGASLASKYNPKEKAKRYFQSPCPYKKKFSTRCPILRTCSTGACMQELSAEKLLADFLKE